MGFNLKDKPVEFRNLYKVGDKFYASKDINLVAKRLNVNVSDIEIITKNVWRVAQKEFQNGNLDWIN